MSTKKQAVSIISEEKTKNILFYTNRIPFTFIISIFLSRRQIHAKIQISKNSYKYRYNHYSSVILKTLWSSALSNGCPLMKRAQDPETVTALWEGRWCRHICSKHALCIIHHTLSK